MGKGNKEDSVEEVESQLAEASIEDNESSSEGEGEEMELTGNMLRRVVMLKQLQEQEDKITEEYKKERCLLEAKYNKQREPLYDQRVGVINGETAPAAVDAEDKPEKDEEDVGLPGFWLQALANHSVTGQMITEEDVDALEAIQDVRCEYNDTMTSFTLTFTFGENPAFNNKTLVKKYTVEPDLLDDQAPTLAGVEALTEFDWKTPESNLLVETIQKKQRAKSGKKKGQIRYVSATTPKPSFFHFFTRPTEDDEDSDEEDEEKESSRVTFNIEEDYDIAHAIRTAIIPHAVGWFTGELIEEDDEDDEDDEEDADEDDEEDADESAAEEEEEEEEVKKPKGKKGKKGKLEGTDAPKDETPECKQS